MRILVFLLLLANLLFLAYAQGYFGSPSAPDALRHTQQVRPELLQLAQQAVPDASPALSTPASQAALPSPTAPDLPASPPAEPLPAASADSAEPEASVAPVGVAGGATPGPALAPVTPPIPESNPRAAAACVLIGGLQQSEAEQLEAQASATGLVSMRRAEGGWWVFMPPQADRKGAERKAGELQRLGVKEFFIVTEGPQRHAISLGIFSREAAAQKHLEQLRSQGVRTARIGQRQLEGARQALEISGDAAALERFRTQLGGAHSPRACP